MGLPLALASVPGLKNGRKFFAARRPRTEAATLALALSLGATDDTASGSLTRSRQDYRHDPNFIMLDILECVNVTQYHTYIYVKSMFLCYIDTQVGANVLITCHSI